MPVAWFPPEATLDRFDFAGALGVSPRRIHKRRSRSEGLTGAVRVLDSVLVGVVGIGQPLGARDTVWSSDLAGEIDQHGTQMLAEAEQVHGAIAAREEERENGLVRFQRVAVGAREDEVVAAVVRSFAAAGRHVVERDGVGMDTTLAVRTDGAVAIEEPLTRVRVSRTTCGQRRVLLV